MLKNSDSFHMGIEKRCVKVISVILTLVMVFGCFGVVSFAANETDPVISNVKVIRPFNKDFSTKKIYDKGGWQAFALADENGEPIYFEYNPIHVGGVYRGYDKTVYSDNYTEYLAWVGNGVDGGRTSFGQKWDVDFPLTWNYDSVHASFSFTTEAYDGNWNPVESPVSTLAGMTGAQDLMFMDHYLVGTEQTAFMGEETVGMYLFEEVFDEKIILNEGETMEVYFEPDVDAEYSDLQFEIADPSIAQYSSESISGLKAGTTMATLTLKRADGSTFTKNFSVEVKSVAGNKPAGFRCSKCDWYEDMQDQGGFMAMIAKLIHTLVHTIEKLTKRI